MSCATGPAASVGSAASIGQGPSVGQVAPIGPAAYLAADDHIRMALREDMNAGDISTESVMPCAAAGEVNLVCKQDGTVAGLWVFERTFTLLDPATRFETLVQDGDEVRAGQLLGVVRGDVRVLLSGERTALNYLQRMSGIATVTHKAVDMLAGSGVTLVDTRKTTPGMRFFEKYAVRAGGATNHRYNLSDAVMLKDNHIAAAGSITAAVAAAKRRAQYTSKVEVEAETLAQVEEALEAGADIIMLDNMTREQMKEAAALVAERATRSDVLCGNESSETRGAQRGARCVQLECSGNFTLDNLQDVVGIGVDFVSCGALTHSAGILDLSMKNLRLSERP